MIKRTLVLLAAVFSLALVMAPRPVKAADCANPNTKDPLSCVCSDPVAAQSATCVGRTGTNDPVSGTNGAIAKVINFVSYITGIAAIIMLMIGGLQYVTSTGDSTKVNNAKNTILYAVIGIVVVVFAQIIVKFVVNKL